MEGKWRKTKFSASTQILGNGKSAYCLMKKYSEDQNYNNENYTFIFVAMGK